METLTTAFFEGGKERGVETEGVGFLFVFDGAGLEVVSMARFVGVQGGGSAAVFVCDCFDVGGCHGCVGQEALFLRTS